MPGRRRTSLTVNPPQGVAGNIVWSTLSRGIQAAAGFAASIAVARHLGLAELGDYLSAMAVAGAVMSVSYCGVQQYLVRETGRGSADAGALLGAGVLIRLGCIGLAGLGLACWGAFARVGSGLGPALVAVALCAEAFRSMGQLAGAVFQAYERMRAECLLAVLYCLAWGALLAGTMMLGYGAMGLLAAGCAALAGHCLVSWAVVVGGFVRPRLAAGARLVGPMLRTSLVIGLSVVLVQNLFRANVLVLQWLGTPEDVAFFQTPHDLVLRFQVLFQAVMLAAFPALSRVLAAQDADARALVVALGRLVAAAACGLALALFVFAEPLLGLLYGAKMLPAAPCLKVVAPATASLALGMFWAQVAIAGDRQRLMLVVNALALALNIVLSPPLTHLYGVVGASASALAAYTASALGAYRAARGLFAGRRVEPVNAAVLAAAGGGALAAAVLPGMWGACAGLGVYAALVAALGGAGLRDIAVLARCARPASRR